MSNIKTGLMFSPLTKRVYWGRMNVKTGVSVGNNQKDVTSEFIGVMLQKFPINTKQNIQCNGKVESVVLVVDEEKANRYMQAKAMYEMLNTISKINVPQEYLSDDEVECLSNIDELLAKARGEHK